MPRFVILTHDWPFPHWDFMLEDDGKLLTWRLFDEPRMHTPLRLEKSADHRLEYLDYIGPVGGNRGLVGRWDNGLLLSLESDDLQTVAEIESNRFLGAVIATIEGDFVEFHSGSPNSQQDC